MSHKSDSAYKNFIKMLISMFLLVLGMTLILVWWHEVVSLFRGFIGIVFALAGLLMLYSMKK